MGLPNILIEFKSKASTAIKRGERGIVAIIAIDAVQGVTKNRRHNANTKWTCSY